MNYTVLWVGEAEQELATLWINEAERAAVTEAAHEIDHRLRSNPDREGESRPHGLRVLFVAPLAVSFEVRPTDRVVHVLDVWKYGTTYSVDRSRPANDRTRWRGT